MLNIFKKKLSKTSKKDEKSFFLTKKKLDQEHLDHLESSLILADFGASLANELINEISKTKLAKDIDQKEIYDFFINHLAKKMQGSDIVFPPLHNKELQIILCVGVNGSGKTTTIAKLASQFKNLGKKPIMVAADTFRAGAIAQLQQWGKETNINVYTNPNSSDPSAIAYGAIEKAKNENYDIVLIDSSGRLQNKSDLMAQLTKMHRTIEKASGKAPDETLLIIDATVGQNALSQYELFNQSVEISGLIITKLDGTAKGGILVPIYIKSKKPIYYVGLGEQINDLVKFDSNLFLKTIFTSSRLDTNA